MFSYLLRVHLLIKLCKFTVLFLYSSIFGSILISIVSEKMLFCFSWLYQKDILVSICVSFRIKSTQKRTFDLLKSLFCFFCNFMIEKVRTKSSILTHRLSQLNFFEYFGTHVDCTLSKFGISEFYNAIIFSSIKTLEFINY